MRRASPGKWRLTKAELETMGWTMAEPEVRKCPRAGGLGGELKETHPGVRSGAGEGSRDGVPRRYTDSA